ncbi:putative ubiquitin-conjugating enzyme E2 38 [Coffea arabica]|uniref:E2 ubiquitin-conjugating enzyme n=1 Tax=Coffea arabica TaxID=13443 RepID=A0A6P6SH36_COFAR|nr:putative ubiquitin-conjugating enzyme E2 38 [Coffea arabica]
MAMEIDQSEDNVAKKLKENEEAVTKDLNNFTSIGGSGSGSLSVENVNSSNSDLSYHDDGNDKQDAVDDDVSDYDDNDDYMFDDDDDDGDYLSMQAQFDNVDLPPGVEASVSWLQASSMSASIPTPPAVTTQFHTAAPSADAGSSSFVNLCPHKNEISASSSSAVTVESSSNGKEKEESEDEIMRKYEAFKSFDTVEDFSDHHYTNMGFKGQQPPKAWTKKIHDEWKILEKDLPDTIFVRVYEARMDLLRAVIVGPQGTPYHDGLFVFDVHFPSNYPDVPPMVYYYSGGLRLNPNLYDCGKVCLSLLNTWSGKGNEKWMPQTSTMLQVLVSIQALILNAKPFFNEPGYDTHYVGAEGERRSKEYNENVFILSLKTMMYTLRRPPRHFEDLVAGHFRIHACDILTACKAYMEGAPVGSLVKGKAPDVEAADKSMSKDFKEAVAKMMNGLVSNFTKYGAKDCEQFRLPR